MTCRRMILCLKLMLFAVLLLPGCLAPPRPETISDLHRFPQDPRAYLDAESARLPLVAPERQKILAAGFIEKHFSPWHAEAPLTSTRNPFWALDRIRNEKTFAENLRPLTPERIHELSRQTSAEAYPSLSRRAVTVRRVDVRALPSQAPLFNNPYEAGQGYPFDLLQHGALPANTPLLVTHLSSDGRWAFIETALLYGWIPLTDLAWVEEDFARKFDSGSYIVVTRDRVALVDQQGIYRSDAWTGALLPLERTEGNGYRILLAQADAQQNALATESLISFADGQSFPLALTPWHIASLAQRMMGQPYGWGEMYSGRDCSATMRDLFAPFGLWLPRNSSHQARVGERTELSDMPPRQREEKLLEQGRPFLTLVRLPGHIMLYIGEHEGRAALLHSLWGLRTRDILGREGRWIVGRTVITSLQPGAEADRLFFDVGSLLDRVESMNTLDFSPGDARRDKGMSKSAQAVQQPLLTAPEPGFERLQVVRAVENGATQFSSLLP